MWTSRNIYVHDFSRMLHREHQKWWTRPKRMMNRPFTKWCKRPPPYYVQGHTNDALLNHMVPHILMCRASTNDELMYWAPTRHNSHTGSTNNDAQCPTHDVQGNHRIMNRTLKWYTGPLQMIYRVQSTYLLRSHKWCTGPPEMMYHKVCQCLID
jgi:hypothetical protein